MNFNLCLHHSKHLNKNLDLDNIALKTNFSILREKQIFKNYQATGTQKLYSYTFYCLSLITEKTQTQIVS